MAPCSPRMWIHEKVRMVKEIQNGTMSNSSSSHLCRNDVIQMKGRDEAAYAVRHLLPPFLLAEPL